MTTLSSRKGSAEPPAVTEQGGLIEAGILRALGMTRRATEAKLGLPNHAVAQWERRDPRMKTIEDAARKALAIAGVDGKMVVDSRGRLAAEVRAHLVDQARAILKRVVEEDESPHTASKATGHNPMYFTWLWKNHLDVINQVCRELGKPGLPKYQGKGQISLKVYWRIWEAARLEVAYDQGPYRKLAEGQPERKQIGARYARGMATYLLGLKPGRMVAWKRDHPKVYEKAMKAAERLKRKLLLVPDDADPIGLHLVVKGTKTSYRLARKTLIPNSRAKRKWGGKASPRKKRGGRPRTLDPLRDFIDEKLKGDSSLGNGELSGQFNRVNEAILYRGSGRLPKGKVRLATPDIVCRERSALKLNAEPNGV